jgi:alpha-pyrone synthase
MSRILAIGTANPPYRHSQEGILQFMQELNAGDSATVSKLHMIYKKSNIDSRYSPLPDYSSVHSGRSLYPSTADLEPFPGISRRMSLFEEHALPLSLNAVEACLQKVPEFQRSRITHLVTVTCTGLSAPGLDIELLKALGLKSNVQRTSVNFMGCYAAVHGIKMADYICRADKDAAVLVVCTELCTLHFQKLVEDDHLIANSLFADGSAALLVCGEATPAPAKSLSLQGFYAEIESSGEKDMAWRVAETGFVMTLSSYIPKVVERSIRMFFDRALQKYGVSREDIRHWALHPGGKRVIDAVASQLGLSEELQKPTSDVLSEYGNMSSATLVFVLESLWENTIDWEKEETVFAIAFGPGITMETMLLKNR